MSVFSAYLTIMLETNKSILQEYCEDRGNIGLTPRVNLIKLLGAYLGA